MTPCEAADTHAHHVYLLMDVQAVESESQHGWNNNNNNSNNGNNTGCCVLCVVRRRHAGGGGQDTCGSSSSIVRGCVLTMSVVVAGKGRASRQAKWRARPASTVMGKRDLRSLALTCRARIGLFVCSNGWRMASSASASLMIAATPRIQSESGCGREGGSSCAGAHRRCGRPPCGRDGGVQVQVRRGLRPPARPGHGGRR